MKIEKITSKAKWDRVLLEVGIYDLYHTYDFHKAHAEIDGGEPALYLIKDLEKFIIFPLLERTILNTNYKDATSVYGYPGPITNIQTSSEFEDLFRKLNLFLLNDEGYISIFSRANSLTTHENLIKNIAVLQGQTINIDLTLSDEEQVKKYRSNHRRDVKKLNKSNFKCSFVGLEYGLNDFIEIYNSTMVALSASDYYFFPKSYYLKLFDNTLSEIKLLQCKQDGNIACMGIFSFTNGIVQYHLGGTASQFYKFAPTKLMFDFVRQDANKCGYKSFHLGGGLGGGEDNLFKFKRGFSDDVRNFYVFKTILNKEIYQQLSVGKEYSNYFPLYRS